MQSVQVSIGMHCISVHGNVYIEYGYGVVSWGMHVLV